MLKQINKNENRKARHARVRKKFLELLKNQD